VYELASSVQEASQAGAVVTRALDRPDTRARRVRLGKAHAFGVAASVRWQRSLRDHGACRCGDDREHMLIAVSVDTDHVVHFVCKHPVGSSASYVLGTPVWMQGARAAGL